MSSFLIIPNVIWEYVRDVFILLCCCYDLMGWQIGLYMILIQ